jgi:hypothetical protein
MTDEPTAIIIECRVHDPITMLEDNRLHRGIGGVEIVNRYLSTRSSRG